MTTTEQYTTETGLLERAQSLGWPVIMHSGSRHIEPNERSWRAELAGHLPRGVLLEISNALERKEARAHELDARSSPPPAAIEPMTDEERAPHRVLLRDAVERAKYRDSVEGRLEAIEDTLTKILRALESRAER